MDNQTTLSESRRVVPQNTWVLITNFKLAYTLLRRPDGTFNRHLAEYLDRKVPANIIPVDGVFSFDVVIDRSTGLCKGLQANSSCSCDYFLPWGSFAHSSASTAIYDTLCRRLVGVCKAVVISVNYRRAPENRYPCAYDDGWAVLTWVHSKQWLRSGKDSKVRAYLVGDKSGTEVMGNVLLNPMFGGIERTESEKRLDGKYFVTFLPEGVDRDHPACNPFGPQGVSFDGIKFPKSLVVVSGLDLVQDWQLAYAEGLKKAGQDVKLVFLEQATIGFYLLPNNNHFHNVMEEINTFVCSDS
ncbi:hypothetical protein MKW92_010876 [Papaver armeniacum]|nr:hypothetical protein MKW92_010876 [Papaver armeniacum]